MLLGSSAAAVGVKVGAARQPPPHHRTIHDCASLYVEAWVQVAAGVVVAADDVGREPEGQTAHNPCAAAV